MKDNLRVLVTGAAGLVGAEVTARLAAAGHEVTALVHHNPVLVRNDGTPLETGAVTCLSGDVTKPRLGLPEAAYQALAAGGLDRIVHCAAITDFGLPDEVYQAVNVDGTAHVVELARAGGVPLVHVSTAYVCGERDGLIRETELDEGQQLANAYEQSKFRAETLVHKAQADGVRAAIVRPSIVVGEERTGVVRDYKNIYAVLKLATEGRVRSIPGQYEARLDLVPVDYVADVITEVTHRFEEAAGRTFHAVGAPLTLRDFSDVMAEYPPFQVPRFVPPTSFDAQRLSRRERLYYERVMTLYESYFRRRMTFDDSHTAGLTARRAPENGQDFLRTIFDHCLESGYLGVPHGDDTEAGGARPDTTGPHATVVAHGTGSAAIAHGTGSAGSDAIGAGR
ncbi:thioester reductase-like protein [Streptomyces sp. 2333.5]|uniref:SDR family oxidoreductase n=1 Tax=unclassified Streptomyces TaxID=2593676 RepID=UPI0008980589|nr:MULTISPECIES: SDR family oxidoreductase [unclassified Streptomyces]PJJ06484.1 thioester reductase-like protein [Streptomyces sp. 2333.5]SEE95964.1 Thioester reductase domain-containing protein [Streptomyces sp. 2314.4]SEF10352.1 Thioester reductase domain-containing protein [Streptomyces sp. 2112.2]SOE09166.1 Thioester reductase domain-containing protein [Streptomyces sp. 2323.1]